MEYAQQGSLTDVMVKMNDHLSEATVRTIFLILVDALDYLHRMGIAHLDLKLENILVDEDDNIKIADFDMSQSLTEKKLFAKGTPSWRAPEIKNGQAKDKEGNVIDIDYCAADIYSLGLILFGLYSRMPAY